MATKLLNTLIGIYCSLEHHGQWRCSWKRWWPGIFLYRVKVHTKSSHKRRAQLRTFWKYSFNVFLFSFKLKENQCVIHYQLIMFLEAVLIFCSQRIFIFFTYIHLTGDSDLCSKKLYVKRAPGSVCRWDRGLLAM